MKTVFRNAWGYQGDAMNLPVENVDAAVPFYTDILGFELISQGESPHRTAVLARADITICLAENGGEPADDGCAFEVDDVGAVFAEFKMNGLKTEISEFKIEKKPDVTWKVFYVVAPDGLCYWFGERQPV